MLYRPYVWKYPPLHVSVVAMGAAVLMLAVLAAGESFFSTPPQFTAAGWLAVGFIGVSSGVGYYLWLWALNRTTATNVTIFLALSPVTAAALGALLLSEQLALSFVLGLMCVVFGIRLAYR